MPACFITSANGYTPADDDVTYRLDANVKTGPNPPAAWFAIAQTRADGTETKTVIPFQSAAEVRQADGRFVLTARVEAVNEYWACRMTFAPNQSFAFTRQQRLVASSFGGPDELNTMRLEIGPADYYSFLSTPATAESEPFRVLTAPSVDPWLDSGYGWSSFENRGGVIYAVASRQFGVDTLHRSGASTLKG